MPVEIKFAIIDQNEEYVVMRSNITPLLASGMDIEDIVSILSFEEDSPLDFTFIREQVAKNFLRCDEEDVGFELVDIDEAGNITFSYTDVYQKSRKFLRGEVGYVKINDRERPVFVLETKSLDPLINFAAAICSCKVIKSSLGKNKGKYYLELISTNDAAICRPFVLSKDFGKTYKRMPESAQILMPTDAVMNLKRVKTGE